MCATLPAIFLAGEFRQKSRNAVEPSWTNAAYACGTYTYTRKMSVRVDAVQAPGRRWR